MVDKIYHAVVFLSTPSARRATRPPSERTFQNQNFYPRPPRGGRLNAPVIITSGYNFYPRPPRGGRHRRSRKFLSTPSARRATFTSCLPSPLKNISIHALREEGDQVSTEQLPAIQYFYPRPPRGGRRPRSAPTPGSWNFYPRPPRGGRPLS